MLLPELKLKRPVTLRSQGQSITRCIGLLDGLVHPIEESSEHIAKSLLKESNLDVNSTWSTMVTRTRPFSESIRPNHHADIKELQPDVIVECYLEAKYYHYDPSDMCELVDFNVNAENLI